MSNPPKEEEFYAPLLEKLSALEDLFENREYKHACKEGAGTIKKNVEEMHGLLLGARTWEDKKMSKFEELVRKADVLLQNFQRTPTPYNPPVESNQSKLDGKTEEGKNISCFQSCCKTKQEKSIDIDPTANLTASTHQSLSIKDKSEQVKLADTQPPLNLDKRTADAASSRGSRSQSLNLKGEIQQGKGADPISSLAGSSQQSHNVKEEVKISDSHPPLNWDKKAEDKVGLHDSSSQSLNDKDEIQEVKSIGNDPPLNLDNEREDVSDLASSSEQSQTLKEGTQTEKNRDENLQNKPKLFSDTEAGKVLTTILEDTVGMLKDAKKVLKMTPLRPKATAKAEEEPRTDWHKLEEEEAVLANPSLLEALASYKGLSLQLKMCFLSLSIFPEGTTIKKRSLIHWWIGEGFLRKTRDREVEQVSQDCFTKLVESGLIEPHHRRGSGSTRSCTLHPWIRWLAISMARESGFLEFDSNGKPSAVSTECRSRACLSTVNGKQMISIPISLDNNKAELQSLLPELQSLFNVNAQYLVCNKEGLSKMKNLKILQLGRWHDDPKYHIEVDDTNFLTSLEHYKRLRYLGLQGISRIPKIPNEIGQCSDLRVLDLQSCHNLEKLPASISLLRKLTHLDASECYLLGYMPKGIGSLTELQVLKGFVVGNSRRGDQCRLNDLVELKKLKKLSISFKGMSILEEGDLSSLQKIESLLILTISWGKLKSFTEEVVDEQTTNGCLSFCKKRFGQATVKSSPRERKNVERTPSMFVRTLQLPPNLEKLDLQCYQTNELPDWLVPGKLKRLYLRGGKLKSVNGLLQSVGGQWKVEILRLKYLEKLRLNWSDLEKDSDLEKVFPHLNFAEIVDCPQVTLPSTFVDGLWEKQGRDGSTPMISSVECGDSATLQDSSEVVHVGEFKT